MSRKIVVDVPEGMEIDRVIFKPVASIGVVDRDIVVNKYGVRIPLNTISKYSRGAVSIIWDKVIHILVNNEAGVTRSEVVYLVMKNYPDIEGNAFEKMVSRIWTECSRYANDRIAAEYNMYNFIQINAENDLMWINSSYRR